RKGGRRGGGRSRRRRRHAPEAGAARLGRRVGEGGARGSEGDPEAEGSCRRPASAGLSAGGPTARRLRIDIGSRFPAKPSPIPGNGKPGGRCAMDDACREPLENVFFPCAVRTEPGRYGRQDRKTGRNGTL